MKPTKIEKELTLAFLKSIGAGCGFYNPKEKKFREGIESEGLYQSNLEIVRDALKNGWTAKELEEFIWEQYNKGERKVLLSDVLPKKAPSKKIDEHANLLEEGIAYQHPALFIRRAPSMVVSSDGVLMSVGSGSITPKETFTLRDLTTYYFDHMHVPRSNRLWTSAMGGLRWLLNEARLDEVLTCIDIAAEKDPDIPAVKLADYLPEARREVQMREARARNG